MSAADRIAKIRRGHVSLLGAGALAVLSAACDPSVSELEPPPSGLIRGSLLYPSGTARGAVNVLLFAESAPPPPAGTGRPVNFVVVPMADLFKGSPEGVAADFTSEFTIPTVPAGRYSIRAFLDADGDFNPFFDVLNQPTAGDVGGGFVDRETGQFLIVEVENNRVSEDGILVTLGRIIPVERPAFAHTSSQTFVVPFSTPQALVLEARAVNRGRIEMDPERTTFLVQYADLNADGVPDDQNGDHLPDVFPQVLLRRIEPDPALTSIVVPAITNPLPFLDRLDRVGSATTTVLELLLPPVALEIAADGARTLLPSIPAGSYETIVISGTGQTWRVPNDANQLFVEESDPTQDRTVTFAEGPALPAGRVGVTVHLRSEVPAKEAFVFAFAAADPPPPAGTGRPRAAATVARTRFVPGAAGAPEAMVELIGLPDGDYLVTGFLDVDSDFSLLADLLAQPSAGDLLSASPSLVTISGGQPVSTSLVLDAELPFDRPAFELAQITLSRLPGTQRFEISTSALVRLGLTPSATRFPVALAGGDANGDNLPDLYPRLVMARLADGPDPRAAPLEGDHPDPTQRQLTLIPALIDPLPFLAPLGSGIPLVSQDRLGILVPPLAVVVSASGIERRFPIPSGRYQLTVISSFGQVFSVPSKLDLVFGRVGTPLEAPGLAQAVTIRASPVASGAISGSVQIVAPVPSGDFQVIVLAFAKNDPPPPNGRGRPRASAVIPKAAFSGDRAAYRLDGLDSGLYRLRAFLDADDDFTPWFETMNQPDAGDVGGGHFSGMVPADVSVDALGPPTNGTEVSILAALAVPFDRPVFFFPPDAVLARFGGNLMLRLGAQPSSNDVLRANAIFPIQWVDLDRNGMADDVNGDAMPDVFPLVVAELLDPSDPENLTPEPRDPVLILGAVDPAQFAAAGFPAQDPTQVQAVSTASELVVLLPPIGIRASGPPGPPPAGVYRITLINAYGQTWSVPNELFRATGDVLAETQGRFLRVSN